MFGKVAKTAVGTKTGRKATKQLLRTGGKSGGGILKTALGTKTGRKATRAGIKSAAKAGRGAGKVGVKAGRARFSPTAPDLRRDTGTPFMKYGFFALAGLAIGALIGRSSRNGGASSEFTDTTGHHAPDAGSPAGQRGQTWGSGTVAGTAGGGTAGGQAARETEYSSDEPLIGESHDAGAGRVPEQQEEVEQRIRTALGEDPRTASMPRVNVEVNDGVAELRGPAPSNDAKQAAGEIAQNTEGVREVRNLLSVG